MTSNCHCHCPSNAMNRFIRMMSNRKFSAQKYRVLLAKFDISFRQKSDRITRSATVRSRLPNWLPLSSNDLCCLWSIFIHSDSKCVRFKLQNWSARLEACIWPSSVASFRNVSIELFRKWNVLALCSCRTLHSWSCLPEKCNATSVRKWPWPVMNGKLIPPSMIYYMHFCLVCNERWTKWVVITFLASSLGQSSRDSQQVKVNILS